MAVGDLAFYYTLYLWTVRDGEMAATADSLARFAICGESFDLEPKYACIMDHTLLDAASIVHP